MKTKKNKLDGIDREILRVLYIKRPLVSRKIASFVGLSAAAIAPRLRGLKENGFLKISGSSVERVFERNYGSYSIKIKSPRSIYWDLDLEE